MLTGRVFMLVFLLAASLPEGCSQAIRFSPLRIQNAPRLSTKAIYHDRTGYMWFGSWHNLGRFDGYRIRYYTRDELSTRDFINSAAKLIFEDKGGKLWIATDAGCLMQYNRQLDRFQAVNDSTTSLGGQASSYVEDEQGNFWLGTLGAGLFHYNTTTGVMRKFIRVKGDTLSIASNMVNDIAFDKDHNLWIATDNGLCRYDTKASQFRSFKLQNNYPADKSKFKSLQALQVGRDGKLYLGSMNGLHVLDLATLEDTHLLSNRSDRGSLSHNEISDLLQDHQGNLWVATVGGGINILAAGSNAFRRVMVDPGDTQSLPSNFISRLYLDQNQTVWVSTFENGIVLHDTRPQLINCIRYNPNNPRSLPNGNVFALLPENDSIIWVGLSRGCLNRLNIFNGRSRQYLCDANDAANPGNNSVEDVKRDGDGNLWVSMFDGGLKKFNPRNGDYKRYVHTEEKNSLASNGVGTLRVDQGGDVWISNGRGVDRLDRKKEKFTHYLDDSLASVQNIRIAGGDINETTEALWFLCSGRLSIFDKRSSEFVATAFGAMNSPQHIVASGNDIIAYFRDNSIRKLTYTSSAGLQQHTILQLDDKILAMCADPTGNVWALSNEKLLKIDLANRQFREIYYSDELPNEPIFPDITADNYGRIFFSLIDEVCWFYADRIENQAPPSRVVFSDFKVFNTSAAVSDTIVPGRFTLKNHISELKTIELSHRESFFSFEFTATEYLEPQKLQYAHKMEGFDKDWVNIGNRNFVSYTSLNPGRYTFMVKAARQEGRWSDQIASIELIIHPPFWKTWWFIAIEVALMAGLVYAFLMYRISQSIRLERLRNEIASDLHDEVGSSLTRISIYSDLLQNGLSKQERTDYARSISNLSRDVINTMSDIIWSIDNRSDSLGDLVIRMKDFASEVLRAKGIEIAFDVNGINESRSLNPVLKQNLYLIFKEAINNIVKHSQSTFVHVRVSNTGDGFLMEVRDNGKGIEVASNARGNGLKNMDKRAHAIGAELSLSGDDGTIITIKCKQL